jgi:glycosyltransferase involved in cell wall biosynthesis
MTAVSIVMPLYDMPDTLEESVASCLAQTLTDFELLIVDDGSPAATTDIARRLAQTDGRITYHRIEHTGNPSAVRNVGIECAQGEYVQFLDADDVIQPEKLEIQTAALRDEPRAVAYSDYLMFWGDVKGRQFERLGPPHCEPWPASLAKQFSLYAVVHRFLFPRCVLLEKGGFDPALTHAEDADLWLRLLIGGTPFVYQPLPFAHYRQHTSHSLKHPEAEIESRRQLVRKCRDYLDEAGLSERYRDDLAVMEALADRPAWAVAQQSG